MVAIILIIAAIAIENLLSTRIQPESAPMPKQAILTFNPLNE